MKKVITTELLPIKLWLPDIEPEALSQAKNLANLPFAFKHIAIMPDCHPGYGMPIGGVLAAKDVVIPNAVGVDIGCGMSALKTSLTGIDQDTLKKIMDDVRRVIPLGFNHHRQKQDKSLMPPLNIDFDHSIVLKEYENARAQLGTLGGGNHFIELQKGADGFIWLMIHSGSRNFGFKTADYYNRLAVKLNHGNLPKNWQLNYLPLDTDEGQNYLSEMRYCVNFAFANRKLMIQRLADIVVNLTGAAIREDDLINIAHNYAAQELHFGKQVLVHRKGATKANLGLVGIIPGSQGTNSYIVKGLGNQDSFESCSHGAGRIMGREEAKRRLNLQAEIKRMNDLGIVHGIRTIKDLDEAPGAYKDIDQVMKNQADLVEIVNTLRPLAVIKT